MRYNPKTALRNQPLPEADAYSSQELSRAFGVSLRQLQFWDERGVVSPQIIRHARCYTRQNALEVSLLAQLRRKGVSLQQARRVLMAARKTSAMRYLVTDLKVTLWVASPQEVIAAAKGFAGPAYVVEVA